MTEDNHALKIVDDTQVWYKDGLQFKCTGCGKCCTGSPGAVWVSDEEVKEISSHLNIPVKDFLNQYTRLIDGKRSLIEDPRSYDCVFLKNNQCTIYQKRPLQCRTYPWWPSNLRSKKDWVDAAKWCEGINNTDSTEVTLIEIQQQLHTHIDGGGH
jgi:uncharacterized protein